MFVDKKGYPYTIQKSKFLEVEFENGFFNVPEEFLGGFMSVGVLGDVNWSPLHQDGSVFITESFLVGDSIARPRRIKEEGTTATEIKIWI